MKRFTHMIGVGIMAWVSVMSAQQNDGAAVRETFRAYWEAIQKRDGAKARSLVTTETLSSYENLRDNALYSTRAQLEAKPIFERLIILNLRLRFTLTELQMTPGADLFSRGIDQGWTAGGASSVQALEDVVVLGGRAEAKIISGPDDEGSPIHFIDESGRWKVDLLSLSSSVEESLQAYLQDGGITEQSLIEETLTASYGKALPNDIWEPLIR